MQPGRLSSSYLEALGISDSEAQPNWCSQVQSVWGNAWESSRVVQGLAAAGQCTLIRDMLVWELCFAWQASARQALPELHILVFPSSCRGDC